MKKVIVCKTCGKEKLDYLSNRRKYCSMSCRPSPRAGIDNRTILVCDNCKKEFKKYNSQIKNYHHIFCSNKCKLKGNGQFVQAWNKGLKGFRSGSQSHLWKGGITSINIKIRGSLEYREWRTAVFERDNYTCVWCGTRSKKGDRLEIQADHIKPFAYYPKLRLDVNNGRTLCISCHKLTDTYMGRGRWSYEKKSNSLYGC